MARGPGLSDRAEGEERTPDFLDHEWGI